VRVPASFPGAERSRTLGPPRAPSFHGPPRAHDRLVQRAVARSSEREIAASAQGRRGWLREARRQLDRHRAKHPRPVPRSRRARLLEALGQLDEELDAERQANEAYEHYRATARDRLGRRVAGRTDPYRPPDLPDGTINVTDPDSRLLKATKGYLQGYKKAPGDRHGEGDGSSLHRRSSDPRWP
jgi:hypothetical protein